MPTVLLVIAPDQFRDEEYAHPKEVLESRGAKVVTGSVAPGPCRGKLGMLATADVAISELDVRELDAVVFVGGAGSSVFFEDATALELAKAMANDGKLIAAICIAPTILANAGLLQEKRATAFPDAREALESGGAVYTGAAVEVDGSVITANGPEAAHDFGVAIADYLGLQQ